MMFFWIMTALLAALAGLLVLTGARRGADAGEAVETAAAAAELAELDRLKARGLSYDLRHLPGSGGWQLFFHDPSGAKVELDFDATETDQI